MQEVRRLRQERGWTQTQLAFHSGLAPSVISQIENDKRDPSASTLKKLARALEVEVRDLFPLGQPTLPKMSAAARPPEVKVSLAPLHLKTELTESAAVVLPVLRLVAQGEISPEEGTERILHELGAA